MNTKIVHATGDEALGLLSAAQSAGSSLVRSFPGKEDSEHPNWLDMWFLTRIEQHYNGAITDEDKTFSFDVPTKQSDIAPHALPVRLEWVQANYFRGLREAVTTINMSDDLMVLEGANSSGKTSLAEALEWLFTGSLSRRANSSNGNSREFEDCVTNQFRPENVETWVSAKFVVAATGGESQEFTLRRVLKQDFGRAANSTCVSVLFQDDKELDAASEKAVLDKYFAGVPPLLMQHTIREFVHADPNKRREYFERLLRLDELTDLIRQAVVSDDRLIEFPSPRHDEFSKIWAELGSCLQNEQSKKAHNQLLGGSKEITDRTVADALLAIAEGELPAMVEGLDKAQHILAVLRAEQARVRQDSFPLLSRLRPKRLLADDLQGIFDAMALERCCDQIRDRWVDYEPTTLAVAAIGDSNLAVAKAFKLLFDAAIIQRGTDSQPCPLCAHEKVETLSKDRIATIQSWDPIREAELRASKALGSSISALTKLISNALEYYDDVLPEPPAEDEWETTLKAVGDRLRDAANELKAIPDQRADLLSAVAKARELIEENPSRFESYEHCESFITRAVNVLNQLSIVPSAGKAYSDAFLAVEAAVGAAASLDPAYRQRESLIVCNENSAEICQALRWAQAKRYAQGDLEKIRGALMTYRQRFLESRRQSFNLEMEDIWGALRKETYSSFSHLSIPKPSGRGFPIAIELKATLDNSEDQYEVDVLKVFSESQVNALGVAAFVTRSKLLGHRMLIMDDPVQSMDEDHFKTFARDLLRQILDDGFQVLLLTHNYTFARDVSNHHYDRPGYTTMSIQHSKRKGSIITEGNRRVHERLKLAERKMDEGDADGAWRLIRLAVERLYTITYSKYGKPGFDPNSWQHQTADYMWNEGTGQIIREKLPDSADRLKEILDMTAGGTHDAQSRGETDVRDSVEFLRQALKGLRVGG